MLSDQEKKTDAKLRAQETRMDKKFDTLQSQISELKVSSASASVTTAAQNSFSAQISSSSLHFVPRSIIIKGYTNYKTKEGALDGPTAKDWIQKCYDNLPDAHKEVIDMKATLQAASRDKCFHMEFKAVKDTSEENLWELRAHMMTMGLTVNSSPLKINLQQSPARQAMQRRAGRCAGWLEEFLPVQRDKI